jgi:Rieske Fe-S protein
LTESEDTRNDESPSAPGSSLWPVGFAIGIALALIGLVVSVWVLVAGVLFAVVFGWLWVRDLFKAHGPVAEAAPGAPEEEAAEHAVPTYDRSAFLSASTIGIGAAIGGLVTIPVLGFMVLPSFEKPTTPEVDLGPITNFPEAKFVIANFVEYPEQGLVSRRTAYVRNNGLVEDGAGNRVPSFTILSSRCVHLGCPVQANGPFDGAPIDVQEAAEQEQFRPTLQPVLAESFGCPCHGGQYDGEGNRTAGPPVRSLDRYQFSIVDGRLVLGRVFSVGSVQGTRADAVISSYGQSAPGVHVDGIEALLYPIPVPYSR